MGIFYRFCVSISFGVVIGFLIGSIKLFRKKEYTEAQKNTSRKILSKLSLALKYITLFMLILGLIWCIYYLVLGIVVPGKADYANNMAELIVAVLTVISIIFAFVEFIRHTDEK